MKTTVLLFSALLMITSCNAQEDSKKNLSDSKETVHNRPNERWTVNKEVDENGNVIRMDSTYVWSYSSDGKQPTNGQMDSIMSRFKERFSLKQFGGFFTEQNDSISMPNFMRDDFFSDGFADPRETMNQMIKMADSIQNEHMKRVQEKQKF